jgi:hypothetical protein
MQVSELTTHTLGGDFVEVRLAGAPYRMTTVCNWDGGMSLDRSVVFDRTSRSCLPCMRQPRVDNTLAQVAVLVCHARTGLQQLG